VPQTGLQAGENRPQSGELPRRDGQGPRAKRFRSGSSIGTRTRRRAPTRGTPVFSRCVGPSIAGHGQGATAEMYRGVHV